MPAAINIAGHKFGRLTAIETVGSDKHGKRLWQFACECGNRIVKTGNEVKSGKTHSCGCLNNEVRANNARAHRAKISEAKKVHGMSATPEYFVWKTMRQRCLNPNSPDYSQYGGRGIAICDAWADFAQFIADMGPRPSDNHSIDRINPDGPYAPKNCRLATAREQRLNQRRMKNGN